MEALGFAAHTAGEWLQYPSSGPWDFNVYCRGVRSRNSNGGASSDGGYRCDPPGCPARKKRLLMFVCAATQFARRVKVLGDRERNWMIRATHNSDEARNPVARRRSVRTTTHRLVRGSPKVGSSAHQWPSRQASCRPAVSFPGGEPQAEPVEPQQQVVA